MRRPSRENFREAFPILRYELFDADQTAAHAIFGQLENRRFRAVQNRVGILIGIERLLLNGVRAVRQASQNRLLLHDAGVVLDIRDSRHAIHELREIRRAARRIEFAAAMQILGERDQIDGLLRFSEGHHPLEDAAMLVEEEIVGAKLLHRRVQHVVVEQNSAENAAFGFQIVG